MRISPLAVWGHKLSNDDLKYAVMYETNLTHSDPSAIEATYLYCFAIKMILKGEKDR